MILSLLPLSQEPPLVPILSSVYPGKILQTYYFKINFNVILPFMLRPSENSNQNLCIWLRHYATSRKVEGSITDEVTGFFNSPNPLSRTMALALAQPLKEMSTRNLPGRGKGRPVRMADNLTNICEPIV
jgi:hypothetical protein